MTLDQARGGNPHHANGPREKGVPDPQFEFRSSVRNSVVTKIPFAREQGLPRGEREEGGSGGTVGGLVEGDSGLGKTAAPVRVRARTLLNTHLLGRGGGLRQGSLLPVALSSPHKPHGGLWGVFGAGVWGGVLKQDSKYHWLLVSHGLTCIWLLCKI